MRREKIRRPRPAPLKRGSLVLLGDGVLLFLVLAGAVGSFCTAFTLDVSLPLVYAGCALCALIFLAVCQMMESGGLLDDVLSAWLTLVGLILLLVAVGIQFQFWRGPKSKIPKGPRS